MKTLQRYMLNIAIAIMLVSVAGCAGMSRRDRCTVGGAGIGAVGGALLTGGSGVGTVGGAAVGGVVGNQLDGCR